MAGRPFRALGAEERGFAVVEVLVGLGIFALLAVGFAGAMASAVRAQIHTRTRTTAMQLATEHIERARALPYDQLGVVNGNPPGVLPAIDPEQIGTVAYEVTTQVDYVDDPIDGGFETSANYKRVVVTVRRTGSTDVAAELDTIVAPPTQPSLTKGRILVTVVDAETTEALAGATVRLTGGPSGTRTGVTNAQGKVTFAALDPVTAAQPHYDVEVTLADYLTPSEQLPEAPGSIARIPLQATQSPQATFLLYRPATLDVDLGGFTGAATAIVGVEGAWHTVPVVGGHVTITELGGEPIRPEEGVEYTIGAFADGGVFAVAQRLTLARGINDIDLTMVAPATTTLQVRTVDGTGNPLAGRTVVVTQGPSNIAVLGVTGGDGWVPLTVPAGPGNPYEVVVVTGDGTTTDPLSVPAGTPAVEVTVP